MKRDEQKDHSHVTGIEYPQCSGGAIGIDLGQAWPGFNTALSDSVSTLPPRGSADVSPSPYWIDAALSRLEEQQARNASGRFIWGNESALLLEGDQIVAHSLYELFDDERMPVAMFLRILGGWRQQVVSARSEGRVSTPPETYRRKPF